MILTSLAFLAFLAWMAQVAVDYLVENLKKTLYLEKEESVPVYELLSVVAAQYNMTAEHYCEVRWKGRSLPRFVCREFYYLFILFFLPHHWIYSSPAPCSTTTS